MGTKQTFGATKRSVLAGCMLGSSQAVNNSFTKKPWAIMVPEGLDLEENPRNLALLE